jgi:hypothetical protein
LNGSSFNVLGTNERIVLMLDLPIKQETEFRNSLYFNFNILEHTFDYIVRILQILGRKLERCIKVQEGIGSNPDDLYNELETAKDTAVASAQSASSSASEAANKLSIINTQAANFQTNYENCLETILAQGVANKSNISLNNLSSDGEKHFLNKMQISNCILEAPNGVLSYSGTTITAHKGLKLVIPNGRNSDGSLKNKIVTLANDISMTATLSSDATRFICYTGNSIGTIYSFKVGGYARLSSVMTERWYNTRENKIFSHNSGETSWSEVGYDCCLLGEYTCVNGEIFRLLPYRPLCLVTEQDIDGQWIRSVQNIASDLSLNSSSNVTYNLRDYLPISDSSTYEVIIRARATSGASSGSWAPVYIETDFITTRYELCGARTRANAAVEACGTCTVLVAAPYRIIVSRSTSYNGTATIDVLAYRKVR